MLGRRLWFKSLIAGTIGLLSFGRATAQEGNSFNAADRLSEIHLAPLRDQLTKGLRVVTAEQAQFVNVVIAFERQGRLPRAMINLVYRWARERNPRVPFPYFEFALRALAKRRNIVLP